MFGQTLQEHRLSYASRSNQHQTSLGALQLSAHGNYLAILNNLIPASQFRRQISGSRRKRIFDSIHSQYLLIKTNKPFLPYSLIRRYYTIFDCTLTSAWHTINYRRVHRAIYAENGKLPASAQCADILVYVFALSRDHEHGSAMSRQTATWRCRVRDTPRLRRRRVHATANPAGFIASPITNAAFAAHECPRIVSQNPLLYCRYSCSPAGAHS